MKRRSGLFIFLAFLLIFVQLPGTTIVSATSVGNESVQVNKIVNPSEIFEGGESEVTINIQGTPDGSFVKPNDIILIIDRSGSMASTYEPNKGEDKMKNAKEAAKGFIDLVDFSKHRVGVVDFASNLNYKDLSTNPTELKQYINGIQSSGGTNTKSSIEKARELLRNHRTDAQPVIILMTDGQATEPSPDTYARQLALEQAESAKSEGVVFYTIALLLKNEDPITSAPNLLMKDMATTAHHHHFVLGSVGLSEIYGAIVKEIGVASAYDVKVTDYISPEFEIVPDSYKDNIPQPTIQGNSISWDFIELKNELLTFKYKIRHKSGAAVGDLPAGHQDIKVDYKDYLGVPDHYTVLQPTIKVKYYAPVITSVIKDKGLVQGGEQIVINGQYFRTDSKVKFGDTLLTNVQYVNSNQLVITAPAGEQGTVPVQVINIDGQLASSTYQYYAIPEFTSINPKVGPLAGGNLAVISGNYFMKGVKVEFGGFESEVKSSSSTQINVIVPESVSPGLVSLKIINPDETGVTTQDAYEYLEGPVITGLNPATGLITGGEPVVITGEHFKPGVQVKFGSITVQAEFISSTEIKVTTPSWGKSESVNVTVLNPDGQNAILKNGFTYENLAPIIESVTPNEGLVTGDELIVVVGKNFQQNSKIIFKDKELTASYIDASHLRVRSPQWTAEEIVDISVKNPDGKSFKAVEAYTYKLPPVFEFTEVTPSNGPLAGGNIVYLKGNRLDSNLSVYFNDAKIAFSVISSEQLSIRVPKGLVAGKVNVKMEDKYQRSYELHEVYEYLPPAPLPAPVVSSVTPNETLRTSGEFIYINGTNFQDGAVVWLKDTKYTVSYINATQLRFRAPVWSNDEIVDVKVVNPDGQSGILTQSLHFTNPPADPAPLISALSPNSGDIAGGYFVVIDGQYFKNGAKVFFGTSEVATSFMSTSQLRVRAPLWSAEETVVLKVVNPDGLQGVANFTFTPPAPAPAPTILELSPSHAVITGGDFIYINGENFSAKSIVKFADQTIAASFMSDKQLRVRTPSWPRAETITISVINADGQEAISSFEYRLPAPPSITTLSPNHMIIDAAELVIINGENFYATSKVYFGNKEVAVTFLSNKQIRVRAPIWLTAETVSIRLVNVDGQEATLTNGFTFDPKPMKPAPVITSISPNSGLKASNMFVYVNGENFVQDAKVSVDNGTPVLASFLSNKQLRFRLPISTKTGLVNVTVINPDGQTVTVTDGFTYQ